MGIQKGNNKRKYNMTVSFDVASGNARKYMKVFNRKIEAGTDLTETESEAEGETDILEETEDVPGVLCEV